MEAVHDAIQMRSRHFFSRGAREMFLVLQHAFRVVSSTANDGLVSSFTECFFSLASLALSLPRVECFYAVSSSPRKRKRRR